MCKFVMQGNCDSCRTTGFASASPLDFEFLCACHLFFCGMHAGAISLDELSLAYSSPPLEMVTHVFRSAQSALSAMVHDSWTAMILACKSVGLTNSTLCCNLLYNYTLN